MSETESIEVADPQSVESPEGSRILVWFRASWLPILLVLGTIVVFWPLRKCDFINFDDPYYVYSNAQVRDGLTFGGVIWAFSTIQTANWHPLTWLSLMTDVRLFGVNPAAHHLVNVLIHSGNVALVFILLYRLTGARWRSAMVAALFAVHPVHVESVAWISERKDVLSTFFGLFSLVCYSEFRRRSIKGQTLVVSGQWSVVSGQGESVTDQVSGVMGQTSVVSGQESGVRSRWYKWSLVFFVLGLMSKPMLVTLPFVMLLLDHWANRVRSAECGVRNGEGEEGVRSGEGEKEEARSKEEAERRTGWGLVLEKWPFFLISAIFCLITFGVQRSGGAVVALTKIPIGLRIENIFVSYARYLGKLFWPADLALPYPYPSGWPWWTVVFCVALVVGLCVAARRLDRGWPFVGTGWLWFLGMLVPVIGIVQVGNQPMADRYAYFPSIGIFIVVAWGAVAALAVLARRRTPVGEGLAVSDLDAAAAGMAISAGRGRMAWWATGLVVILAFGVLAACVAQTRKQLVYWENSENLFRHAVAATRNNSLALDSLGLSLLNEGRVDEAMACYQTALQVHPKDVIARDGVGCCFFRKGQLDEAIQNFKQVLEIDTNQSATLFNLGGALAQQQHYDEAIPYFKASLRLEPNDADTLRSLGNVYYLQQRYDEAVNYYTQAVRAAPKNVDAHRSLAAVLFVQGRLGEAGMQCEEVLRLVHRDPEANKMIAKILVALDRRSEAGIHLVEVLKVKPDDAEAAEMLRELANSQRGPQAQ